MIYIFILNLFLASLLATESITPHEKHIVIVSTGHNNALWYRWNLDSVYRQNYTNYELRYCDDGSTDGTFEHVNSYVKECGQEHRTMLVHNEVRYGSAIENQYHMIHQCDPHDIIIILDADDHLAHPDVLSYINNIYDDPHVWMTFGQYRVYPEGYIGQSREIPAYIVEHNAFREYPFVQSHLRTFRAALFQKICPEDFMYQGNWMRMAGDVAAMIPMCEMACYGHIRFIPDILLDYNGINPINDHKISQQLQGAIDQYIRTKPRYEPLEKLFD